VLFHGFQEAPCSCKVNSLALAVLSPDVSSMKQPSAAYCLFTLIVNAHGLCSRMCKCSWVWLFSLACQRWFW
jgi:hypothetical protein